MSGSAPPLATADGPVLGSCASLGLLTLIFLRVIAVRVREGAPYEGSR
jgi:hypothetical protein